MHSIVVSKRVQSKRMPASVRAAQTVVTLHGLVLSLPLALLYAIQWATQRSFGGGVVAIAVLATIAFPVGLAMMGVGLTGFPYWRVSRWVAYAVEVGLAGALLWAAAAADVSLYGRILIALPLGLIPAFLCVILLSRPSADSWFRGL